LYSKYDLLRTPSSTIGEKTWHDIWRNWFSSRRKVNRLNKRYTIHENSSLYWSLNLLFSKIKVVKLTVIKIKNLCKVIIKKNALKSFREGKSRFVFCLNVLPDTCVFISTLLVKYFAHCNQGLVKFVVISSWPDQYNEKIIGSNQTSLLFVVCLIQTTFQPLTLVKCNY